MAFWDTVLNSPPEADTAPPAQASRLSIPEQIDYLAEHDPQRICFSVPRPAEVPEGFQEVNYITFANAVNRTACFLQREIGRGSVLESPVLYIGDSVNDLRCVIVFVALMKTGHQVLFSPSSHPTSSHIALIRSHDCTILLHTGVVPLRDILHHCQVETVLLPSLETLLDETTCEPYRYIPSPSPHFPPAT